MKLQYLKKHKLATIIILSLAVIIAGILIYFFAQSRFNPLPQIIASQTDTKQKSTFPIIEKGLLSAEQIKVLDILKTEHDLNPPGTKYSEGIEEAWCADFVSWVYKEAGVPLSNPNSGSWRIPGTYTLREYYEAEGKFQPASSDYSPKIGDIMLYDNPSPFGQHTNIVINNERGVVTTIGGNEPGGIRIVEHTKPEGAGFIGYGVF